MKLLFRLWPLLFIPASGYGQTKDPGSPGATDGTMVRRANTDSTHHTDTASYHFSYATTGTVNNTNSLHSWVWNNALRASMAKKSSVLNFNSSYIYGQQNHVLTNKDFTSTLDFDLYKSLPHSYYWGLATYTSSVSLLINHQLQTGAGLGYNLVDKKKTILNLSDGVLYEKGDLFDSLYGGQNGNTLQRDRYQTVRNSFRLLYHFLIKDRYTLDGTWFLQNALHDWNDYIMKWNGSVAVKLYKWLSFSVAMTYNKFTRTRSENTLLTFGLTFAE